MWTILRTVKDWEAYQRTMVEQLGVAGMPVAWGNGPKEFPCLVATYSPPVKTGAPPRLVSAYVYVSDAESLIAATGVSVKVGGKPEEPKEPNQDDFNRWVASYLLALVRELREIKALKAELFEKSLMSALQLVDEVVTQKKDELRESLDKPDRNIIDRLYPAQ